MAAFHGVMLPGNTIRLPYGSLMLGQGEQTSNCCVINVHAVLMLAQRRRLWANIKPALAHCSFARSRSDIYVFVFFFRDQT